MSSVCIRISVSRIAFTPNVVSEPISTSSNTPLSSLTFRMASNTNLYACCGLISNGISTASIFLTSNNFDTT